MEKVTVYFGGCAHENWSDDGLKITYSDSLPVGAVKTTTGWKAAIPSPRHYSDVKIEYNEQSRISELVSRLNAGKVSLLTVAYFHAAADAALAFSACGGDIRRLPKTLRVTVDGGLSAVILPELLRILLDQHSFGWEGAFGLISECSTLCCGQSGGRIVIGSLEALQPRDAVLVQAINKKLCQELWGLYPGDWRRIGANAVLRGEEVDLMTLSAYMCGRIICERKRQSGEFRALYTLMPAKFE